MKSVMFKNAMGNEIILNLSIITSVEKMNTQKSIQLSFGKEHIHVNFKSFEDRDAIFEQIKEAFGVQSQTA
jgi:hypothetical protein